MATEYRYIFADLSTNTILAELPLTNVTFGANLNSAGNFSGELLITDLRELNYDITDNTTPGRTAIYVDRNGVLVWGGIIWSRVYNSTAQKMSFTGREFESYFEHRRVTSTNVFAIGTDQLSIVQTLFKQAQGQTTGSEIYTNPGNIGVVVGSETSSQLLTSVYPIFDYERRPILDAVRELSAQASPYGFDFNIDVAYDGSGNPTKTLKCEYPYRGTKWTSGSQTAQVLEFPGQVVDYEYPEDGNSVVNTLYGYGAGSSPGQYLSTATDTAQIASGWPILENTLSLSNILNPTIVDSMTSAQVFAQSKPITVIKLTWDAYNTPTLGDFKTGDEFRIRINDPRFPDGLDIVRRLSRYDVTVGENGPERITASFIETQN